MSDGLSTRQTQKYGWKRDIPDQRDLQFVPQHASYPPHTVMLTDQHNIAPIYDQGQLGSCTGNGIAFLVEFYLMNKSDDQNPTAKLYMPSRLFIYYFERVIEHTVPWDAGAQIRDGIKVVARKGVSDEDKWPYDISQFKVKPSDDAIAEAKKFKATEYARITNPDRGSLVAALDQGNPIVFGFTVYESFESAEVANTGIVPMPDHSESILGGHCVVIVGYSLEGDYFLVRNSWGPDWGINGYFKMPAEYVTNSNLASDFWIITKLEIE